jgi:hypothetical protein
VALHWCRHRYICWSAHSFLCTRTLFLASVPGPRSPRGLRCCLWRSARTYRGWPTLQATTSDSHGPCYCWLGARWYWLSSHVRAPFACTRFFVDASRSSAQDRVSTHTLEDNLAWTDLYRILYSIALAISTSRPAGKDQPRNCGALIDFRGFLDLRYAVLCIGGFFAQLGQWIPSYYISKLHDKVPSMTITHWSQRCIQMLHMEIPASASTFCL